MWCRFGRTHFCGKDEHGATRGVSSNQQERTACRCCRRTIYGITIEANEFKTIHQYDLVIEADQQAGQQARQGFALTVGSRTESIIVEDPAAAQPLRRMCKYVYRVGGKTCL